MFRLRMSLRRTSAMVWLIIIAGLFFYLKGRDFPITGDGREYILMSQSLMSHGSPELRVEDVNNVISSFKIKNDKFYDPDFNCLSNSDCLSEESLSFFKSTKNDYYSWHFFGYSLLNLPSYVFFNYIKSNPTVSFAFTNIVIFLLAMYFLIFKLNERLIYKIIIFSGIMTTATINYFKWNHPESVTLSLIVISLVFLKSGKYKKSAIVLAICSMQNPPIAFTSLAVYLFGLLTKARKEKDSMAKSLICSVYRDIPFATICALLILFPSIFYFYNFGTPNLILEKGSADYGLISLERVFGFYFDLNQGMLLLIPAFFIISPFFIICLLQRNKNIKRVSLFIFLIFLSVISAVPSTQTTNWNPGTFGVLRYAYWNSIFIIFAIAELILSFNCKWFSKVLSVFLVISQIVLSFMQVNDLWYAKYFLTLSPVSSFVLMNFPDLYNPNPEIVLERTLHREGDTTTFFKNGKSLLFIRNGMIVKQIGNAPIKNNECKPILLNVIENVKYWKFNEQCKLFDNNISTIITYP